MNRLVVALLTASAAVGVGCGGGEVTNGHCEGEDCPLPDPCESAPRGDGWYCGDVLDDGEPDTRYHCIDGVTTDLEPCEHGCVSGQCVLVDPCAGLDDGWYCGDSLGGGDPTARFHCLDGVTTDSEPCEHGCEDGACLVPDPCASLDDGWHCGDSLEGGDPTARHLCLDGVTADLEPCEHGCEDGVCILADPCEYAVLGNGWYCGESLGAGDLDTRYYCVDGATAELERCEHGCARQPPGQHDLCAPAPGGYLLPFECGFTARVTQGNNGTFSHSGMSAFAFDFGVARGTVLVAARGGTVRRVKNDIRPGHRCWEDGGYDCRNDVNYVLLAHDDGTDTLYLHLDEASVAVDATVTRGQRIGLSGSTGYSTGPHLHMQRQERCASWWCQSVPMSFDDVAIRDGVPVTGDDVTSGNCP